MTKYYFDIRTTAVVYEDLRGVHCVDIQHAWHLAFDDACSLYRTFKGEADEVWIDVCDGSRRTVATVSLAAFLAMKETPASH